MHEELGARLRAVIARVEALAERAAGDGHPEWSEQQCDSASGCNLQREAAVKFGSLFGGKLTTRFLSRLSRWVSARGQSADFHRQRRRLITRFIIGVAGEPL
jgi:hypothetical protein